MSSNGDVHIVESIPLVFGNTILGFGNLASCNLERFVGFFCMGLGESIMDTDYHF